MEIQYLEQQNSDSLGQYYRNVDTVHDLSTAIKTNESPTFHGSKIKCVPNPHHTLADLTLMFLYNEFGTIFDKNMARICI